MNIPYSGDMKMRRLIADNPMLLAALTRFGISLGFGEATVREVCAAADVHTPTFLAVANYISSGRADAESIDRIDIASLTGYLSNAHTYFLEYVAPRLRGLLLDAVSTSDGSRLPLALIRFFDEYIAEVKRHMDLEENTVFGYVRALSAGMPTSEAYNIDSFSKSHMPIHGKLAEMKDLLICHFTADKGRVDMMNTLLFDIVTFENDLDAHCALENDIFIPAVRRLERCSAAADSRTDETPLDEKGDVALTPREKEIVAEVARGLSNKEIAGKLFLSVHTVATHRRNIFAKLNLHSSSALTLYAIMHGLL